MQVKLTSTAFCRILPIPCWHRI